MKIAICDDHKNQLDYIAMHVGSVCAQSEISLFSSIADLFRRVEEGYCFDSIFMDIEWDGHEENGIDFAAKLHKLSAAKIVFITAHLERYFQGIFLKTTNVCGFVQKPIDQCHLRQTLERVAKEIMLERFKKSRKLSLMIKGATLVVPADDILYIESNGRKATVHTKDSMHEGYETLDNLAKRLPGQFIRTHQSYLVNMDKIKYVEGKRLYLEGGRQLDISRPRYKKVRDTYFLYTSADMGDHTP